MKINTAFIELSNHAYERMVERFPNVSKNKVSATNHTRSLVKGSKYIGIVPDKEGKDSHMFVWNNETAIHVSLDLDVVTTIYGIERKAPVLKFRSKVESIYEMEFRKTHRVEHAHRKKLKFLSAENEVEIANLRLRKIKTRSQNVRDECDKRITQLQNEIWKMNSEIKNIQIHKREIAYAIATQTYSS